MAERFKFNDEEENIDENDNQQDDLEKEIIKSLSNEDYYKDKRKELKSVFFKYNDNKSSHRIWEHINSLNNQ